MNSPRLLSLEVIEKLIANNRELETHVKINPSDTAPICYGDHMNLLATARAALRVVEAEQKRRHLNTDAVLVTDTLNLKKQWSPSVGRRRNDGGR